jgi:hypothetical protein
MFSLWLLLAILLAASMYFGWRIRCTRRSELGDSTATLFDPEPTSSVTIEPQSAGGQARVMKWISIGECTALLAESSDVILIDLRADAQQVPLPVPPAFVLPVTTNGLDYVLRWLPPDESVVFCGASNLSIFMILTGSFMEGSAPIYFLKGDLSLAEVA